MKEEYSWKKRWVWHAAHNGEMGGAFRILNGKLEGTGLL
jgi:hypothetical protein